jgi:hypothetical protein
MTNKVNEDRIDKIHLKSNGKGYLKATKLLTQIKKTLHPTKSKRKG